MQMDPSLFGHLLGCPYCLVRFSAPDPSRGRFSPQLRPASHSNRSRGDTWIYDYEDMSGYYYDLPEDESWGDSPDNGPWA